MDADYYDILQVSPNADPAVIEAAYRQLLAKYQPAAATDPEAVRRLQSINDAYAVLSNPNKRAQYDWSRQGIGTSPTLGSETPTPTNVPSTAPPIISSHPPTTTDAPAPHFAPPTPVAARRGLPVWLLGLVGLCALVLIGTICIVGFVATTGAFGFLTNVQKTVVVLVPTSTVEPQPTSTTLPTEIATSAPTQSANTGGASFVTNLIMAPQTQGDNFDPVGPTNTFEPGDTFHAVVTITDAPANTTFKAVWFADDVGSAAAPNTQINVYSLTSDGSRNLDFTLKPKTTWAAGTYHIDIYANGTLAKSAKFTVQGASSSGSNIIQSTTFARSVTDQVFDPVDPTTTFTPGDKVLHLVVSIANAPDNTDLRASWYFGQQVIDTASQKAGGTRNVDFSLTQNKPWPVGNYHVDLFINGNLDRSPTFTVQ